MHCKSTRCRGKIWVRAIYPSWSKNLAIPQWHLKYEQHFHAHNYRLPIPAKVLLFISFVALHYPVSENWQCHLLVANRTIFSLLPFRKRLHFNPFSVNRIFLSIFVFNLFIVKLRPDFWIPRYIFEMIIMNSDNSYDSFSILHGIKYFFYLPLTCI